MKIREEIDIDNLVEVGKVVRTHGLDGDIIVDIQPKFVDSIIDAEFIFINVDSLPLPFEVNEDRTEEKVDGSVIMSLKLINSMESAKVYVNSRILLNGKDAIEADTGLIEDTLIGYRLLNESDLYIGTISEINDYSGNIVMSIDRGDDRSEETLIPLVEEGLIDIDHEGKTLKITIAEGLLDM